MHRTTPPLTPKSAIVLSLVAVGGALVLAIVFRLLGRDVLGTTFDRSAATYWVPRQPTTDVRRYFRQF